MRFSLLAPLFLALTVLAAPGMPGRASTPRGPAGYPWVPVKPSAPAAKTASLLDESGQRMPARPVGEVLSRRHQLHTGAVSGVAAARDHIFLGEWDLAKHEDPAGALAHFRAASRLSALGSPERGLAAFDSGLALFYLRDYRAAANQFKALSKTRGAQAGYSPRAAALWGRRAGP